MPDAKHALWRTAALRSRCSSLDREPLALCFFTLTQEVDKLSMHVRRAITERIYNIKNQKKMRDMCMHTRMCVQQQHNMQISLDSVRASACASFVNGSDACQTKGSHMQRCRMPHRNNVSLLTHKCTMNRCYVLHTITMLRYNLVSSHNELGDNEQLSALLPDDSLYTSTHIRRIVLPTYEHRTYHDTMQRKTRT